MTVHTSEPTVYMHVPCTIGANISTLLTSQLRKKSLREGNDKDYAFGRLRVR